MKVMLFLLTLGTLPAWHDAHLLHLANEVLMMADDDVTPLKDPRTGTRFNPMHILAVNDPFPYLIPENRTTKDDVANLMNSSGVLSCSGAAGHFTVWGEKTEIVTQLHVITQPDGSFRTDCKILHQGESEIPDAPLVLNDNTVLRVSAEGRDPDDWPALIRPPEPLLGKNGKPLPGVKLVDKSDAGFDYKQKALLYTSIQTYGDDGKKAKNEWRKHGLIQQCQPHADKDYPDRAFRNVAIGNCWLSPGASGGAVFVRERHSKAGPLVMAGNCSEGGYSNMDGKPIHKDKDPHKGSASVCVPFSVEMLKQMEDFDKKDIHFN